MSHGEPLASLSTAALQDFTAVLRAHPFEESVGFLASTIVRLKRTLHCFSRPQGSMDFTLATEPVMLSERLRRCQGFVGGRIRSLSKFFLWNSENCCAIVRRLDKHFPNNAAPLPGGRFIEPLKNRMAPPGVFLSFSRVAPLLPPLLHQTFLL